MTSFVLCRREQRAILVKHGASETVAWRGGQLHPQKLIDVNPRRAVLCADESRAFFLYARALRGEVVGAEVDHAHGVRWLPFTVLMISRPVHVMASSKVRELGLVFACQVRSRKSRSLRAKAQYRARIRSSAVGGLPPRWNGPQHCS